MESHRGHPAYYVHGSRRHVQHRRSSPIEIPTRRRSTRHVRSPPKNVAASPELIFDMSPPDYTLDSVLSTSRAQKDDRSFAWPDAQPMYATREPFLYSFPMLSSHQPPSKPEHSVVSEVSPCHDAADTQSNAISTTGEGRCKMHCFDQLRWDGEDSPSTSPAQATLFAPTRTARIITAPRTVGFRSTKFLTGCNPSSRPRSPFPSSLFRSCEASSFEEVASSCSPTDRNMVGFESYLVQRIDDERSVRVSHNRKPISSVRISVRV